MACSPALGVVPLRRLVSQSGRPARIGCGIAVEHGISPSVRVRESLTILLDELDPKQITRHRVWSAYRKRGIGYLLRSPLNLRYLGALWEGFPIAGNAFLVSVNHYGIRNDESDHVCGVGQTRANSLPVFVSLELGECEPVRNFHRVSVLGSHRLAVLNCFLRILQDREIES